MDEVLSFVEGLFRAPFFTLAKWVWDWIIGLCTGVVTTSPQDFSHQTWAFVENTLYPWTVGIGASLLSLFFIIGFLKAAMNLKENLTMELCVEALMRLVVVNVVMQSGIYVIRTMFTMAAKLGGAVLSFESPQFFTSDQDVGSQLFWWLFGFGYFLVALVCAVMIFLTLYGRYIKLYLLVLFFPFAVPPLLGGRGIDGTTYAWVKTFLSNTFEIVAIAAVMSVTGMLISEVSLPTPDGIAELFDGFVQAIHSMIYMILMTSSVKGVSALMNKAFNL